MKFPYRLLVLTVVLGAATFSLRAADAPATVAASSATAPGARGLAPGDVAPDFTVTGPKGETIKLSDFAGKIVIVDVSATWCGPCQAAMPNNDRIYRKYADQGVVLLGITADDSREAYDGWIKRSEGKYTFLMAFDPAGRDGWNESVFNTKYHVSGFPTMFVIGRDGKIVETLSGGGPGEDYRLEYALARAGAKVDLAAIPPEPKKQPGERKSIPMVGKTPAMPAATAMIGMGAPAPASGGFTPEKFGSITRGAEVPDFTVTGKDGQPVKLSSFRGKTLLVQFCTGNGPQPWLAKIAAAYQDQPLNVLAVFSATERADFDKWVAANPHPGFSVAWDPAGKAWAENATNTIFGVGMYPATAVLSAEGKLWSGAIGMGDKVIAMTYSMLARNGVKLTQEHMDALVAAGGAMPMGGTPAPAGGTTAAQPAAPKAPFSEKYGKLKAGDVLPDFTVMTNDGKEAKFSDFAKGKTVVLDFWATWCGPCQQAMPHYEEMHRKYAAKGVVFLGICCFDTRPNYDKWVEASKGKYTFTTVFDPVGKPAAGDKEAMKKTIMMQLSGGALTPLPTTLVINAEGKLVGNYVGYGPGTHAGLANLLMLAGVELAAEDKPKEFFPAGSTARKPAEAAGGMMAAATIKPAPAPDKPAPARPATLAAGAVAPDFVMKDLAGKDVKLSDFKGKVVILDFWATWCGPCIGSFPHTAKIAAQYKDQDVVVLASCTSDTRAAFEKWVPANQEKYAAILFAADPNERGSATFDKRASSALYGVVGIPTQFVIGRDGKIVATIVGNGGEGDPRTEGALALAGVKIDEALATRGKAALVAAAEEAKQSAIQAAETAKNPPPPFFEGMGKLVKGQPLPLVDFTAQGPDGQPVKFSDLAKGKTVVLNVWNALNASDFVAFEETWARNYAGQNVQFVALISYCSREDYDKFLAANAGKFSFPVIFDPIGRFASPG
ncbi:MAG: redoxin domain-containing protein, partial [Lacunisphaera sp.]|nr:redoxin domain-containing protein [Lacunisphaera sp.]